MTKLGFTEEALSDFSKMSKEEITKSYEELIALVACSGGKSSDLKKQYLPDAQKLIAYMCDEETFVVLDVLDGEEIPPSLLPNLRNRMNALQASNHVKNNLETVNPEKMHSDLFCNFYLPEVRPNLFGGKSFEVGSNRPKTMGELSDALASMLSAVE